MTTPSGEGARTLAPNVTRFLLTGSQMGMQRCVGGGGVRTEQQVWANDGVEVGRDRICLKIAV